MSLSISERHSVSLFEMPQLLQMYLVSNHEEKWVFWVHSRRPGHFGLSQGIVGKNNRLVQRKNHLNGTKLDKVTRTLYIHFVLLTVKTCTVSSHIWRVTHNLLFYPQTDRYLQYPSIWGAKVSQRVIPSSGDEDGGEKDVSHLPVEEVLSVDRLWHQSGFGAACNITLRVLQNDSWNTTWSQVSGEM